jgi:hypothetical protein
MIEVFPIVFLIKKIKTKEIGKRAKGKGLQIKGKNCELLEVNLFIENLTTYQEQMVQKELLWHIRLGHFNFNILYAFT